jgi:hypothetical protein
MARLTLKPGSWPIPLRWLVAMVVVPMLPLVLVGVLLAISLALHFEVLFFVLIAIGYALAACILATWLTFLPVYFAIDRWGQHSKGTYQWASVVAVAAVAFLILVGSEVLLPSSQGIGNAVAFGLAVALPTAPLVATIIWCVLWSGRAPEGEAR